MAMYHQYRDLPQIPSFSDDPQFAIWNSDHLQAFRQHSVQREEEVNSRGIIGNGMGMQTMQRFLLDASPLTPALLHAKLDRGLPLQSQHLGRFEQQWPAPDLLRFDSPDRTSVSGSSSYATQSELRSPYPYHSVPYGSPEELSQSAYPYPTADNLHGESYAPDLQLAGGSVSLRELEYEHHESEPTLEETDPVDLKTEAVYDEEPVHTKMDTIADDYKNYSDSGVSISQRDAESVQPMDPSEEESSDPEYTPNRSARRRRSSASANGSGRHGPRRRGHARKHSTTSTLSQTNRVNKRTGRAHGSSGNSKPSSDSQSNGDAQRHFPCPLATYGCQSTFSSKNEWKRHVGTQHIKLGFWRCDLCATTVDPHDDQTVYHNDFNRKDLFTQHLRRMHAVPTNQSTRNQREYPVTEDNLVDHQKRCYRNLRNAPPQSRCLFCDETFNGPSSWDNRMEHIGRHLEKDRKAGMKMLDIASWNVDKNLERWLLEEGLIALDRSGAWKIGDGRPRRYSTSGSDADSEEEAA